MRMHALSFVALLSEVALWLVEPNDELFTEKFEMEFHYLPVTWEYFLMASPAKDSPTLQRERFQHG